MMTTKFNVGDKVRVSTRDEDIPYGTELTVKSGPYGSGAGGNYYFYENNEIILGDDLELVESKPKKSARITALETEVVELKAKVEALEQAVKFPLTARFNREFDAETNAKADRILAEIKRKAFGA